MAHSTFCCFLVTAAGSNGRGDHLTTAVVKGIILLLLVWQVLVFLFVLSTLDCLRFFHTGFCLNANWIHIDRVHTAKFYNRIVTELLLACHTHCSPSNSFHSGFTKPTFQNTHQSLSNYLPYCVAGNRWCGTWILTNYTRSLGKLSRFQQHLVSCIPAWQTIVVGIVDGEYSMCGGLDAKASTMLLFAGA